MKRSNNVKSRKLSLTKTTIRHLNNTEMEQVDGGITAFNCTITPNVCPRELTSDNC